MHKISVVITVLNGEKTLDSCLKSVTWADEIVIVDDGSSDGTLEIARKYTKTIYPHKSQGFVEPSRNYAIHKATGDWILILDADEEVPESLAKKLQDIVAKGSVSTCVRLPRKNIIFNKWVQNTGWWPDYHMRFFKKGSVIWSDKIHSHPEIKGLVLDLGPEKEFALVHHNYESISQFLRKLDSYTTITVNEKIDAKEKFTWTKIISAPFEEFLSRYFARKGYKDGLHGLTLSILMAFYEFVIYVKLWEKLGFPEIDESEITKGFDEVKNSQKQLHFWMYSKQIEEASNVLKKNLLKTKRKFNL